MIHRINKKGRMPLFKFPPKEKRRRAKKKRKWHHHFSKEGKIHNAAEGK